MKSPDNRPLRITALKAIKFGASKAAFHRLATPEKVIELLDDLDKYRKALELVYAECENDKCNEMDSLITCVGVAAHALGKE